MKSAMPLLPLLLLILIQDKNYYYRDASLSEPRDSKRMGLVEPSKLTPEDLVQNWNALCGKLRPNVELVRIAELTASRRQKCVERLRAHPAIDFWRDLFKRIEGSPLLRGQQGNGYEISFDWLIENNTSVVKVYEGQYERRAG